MEPPRTQTYLCRPADTQKQKGIEISKRSLRFPTVTDARAVNWRVRDPDEKPEFPDDADELNLVESALKRASTERDLASATTAIAFEIAHSQGFYEGNKRTAFILAKQFWIEHADAEFERRFEEHEDEIAKLLTEAARGKNVKSGIIDQLTAN